MKTSSRISIMFLAAVFALLWATTSPLSQRYPIPGTGNVKSYGTVSLLWTGQAVATNGQAVFFLTEDGLPTGLPIFSGIDVAISTCKHNVDSAVATPVASIRDISADLKTVLVNVISGTNITVTGAGTYPTAVFLGGTNSVFLFVAGK